MRSLSPSASASGNDLGEISQPILRQLPSVKGRQSWRRDLGAVSRVVFFLYGSAKVRFLYLILETCPNYQNCLRILLICDSLAEFTDVNCICALLNLGTKLESNSASTELTREKNVGLEFHQSSAVYRRRSCCLSTSSSFWRHECIECAEPEIKQLLLSFPQFPEPHPVRSPCRV